MPVTLERIAREARISHTEKAVVTTLTVKQYENGLVEVNGVPMDEGRYLSAMLVLGEHLRYLSKQAYQRFH